MVDQFSKKNLVFKSCMISNSFCIFIVIYIWTISSFPQILLVTKGQQVQRQVMGSAISDAIADI